MCNHEQKYCPRCSRLFECRVGSIMQCQCSQIRLSEAEMRYIEKHYTDCLCFKCQEEIRILLLQPSPG